jgi:hypothetical protein
MNKEPFLGSTPAAESDKDTADLPLSPRLPSRSVAGVESDSDQVSMEEWAEKRRILPAQLRSAAGESTNPDYWKLAAVKAFKRWTDGHRATEAQFDEALSEALGQSFR